MSRKPCLKWTPNLNNDGYEDISFELFIGSSDSIFVGRARIGKNKIPGKGLSTRTTMYYSWEGRERGLPDSECEFLTLSPECSISWVPHDSTSGNPLPTGAVIGGNLNNVPVYFARKYAVHLPGDAMKYSSGYYDDETGLGHFPYGGLDIIHTEIDVLVVQE